MTMGMTGSSKVYPPGRPLQLRRNARVLATAAAVPDQVVTNDDLIRELDLIASDRAVQHSIGIRERRRAAENVPTSKYLCEAAQKCIDRAGISAEQLDRVIYCRLFGDHAIPTTSMRVLEGLHIGRGVPAIDISAACSGFMHATELALSAINAGDDYVLILAGDRVAPVRNALAAKDTTTVFLNGDGVAAMLLGHSDEPRFRASYFYTDSDLWDWASIPFGTETMSADRGIDPKLFALKMPDGPRIHRSVIESCKIVTERLLTLANLSLKNIDFFITSDQTHFVWRDQLKLLGLTEDQSVSCFAKYGNTVAAMAPLNLNEAIETGRLERGMTVLMMAHGAGASGGGFIFTY